MTPPSLRSPAFTSLCLSGGNALGAYEAGAYEALHVALDNAGQALDLVTGASIGAIQATLIAGNAPADRVARLRAFWELASVGSSWWPAPADGWQRDAYNRLHAMQTMLTGRPGLFAPNASGRWSLLPGTPPDVGLFDAAPMKATLERLVDFDRVNDGSLPLVLGSVDLVTGEAVYFDSRVQRIEPRHVLASAAFIPGFPPVEIDGRLLGDPGMMCNLPIDPVLGVPLDRDQRCYAVDLFDLHGEAPRSMDGAVQRVQDISFAAQSIRTLEAYRREHTLRHALARRAHEAAATTSGDAVAEPVEIEVVLIAHRPPPDASGSKALDFSKTSIGERWTAGHDDMTAVLDRLRRGDASRRDPGFTFYDGRRREPVTPG